jgi:hypothetical protein
LCDLAKELTTTAAAAAAAETACGGVAARLGSSLVQAAVTHLASVACRRFGVDYSSSCSIDLASLLSQLDYTSNGPRFYDPYIMQVGCFGGSSGVYMQPSAGRWVAVTAVL